MSTNKIAILEGFKNDIEKQIKAYNTALKNKDLEALTKADEALKEAEKAYAELKATIVYDELRKDDNPLKAAIIKHDYNIIGHKTERNEGVVVGYEIINDKVKQIDLVKFCKYCKIDTAWQYRVEKFNKLLCLRAAKELKLTPAQIKKIDSSFAMNALARDVEIGKTPDSNTAVCKQLQAIIDAVIFEDNGKGSNTYKANNHDVAYLLMCYTKKGRNALSVATAKHQFIHRIIADVMHRIVCDKRYDLEYKISAGNVDDNVKNVGKNAKTATKTATRVANTETVTKVTKAG